jgi:hypothetical protein
MRPSVLCARPLRALPGFYRAPLLSLSKEPPLHRHHVRVSTPSTVPACAIPAPSIGRYHRTNTFRPRRFSRPRRLAPHRALQVYCTLLPVMGSAWFPNLRLSLESTSRSQPTVPSSSDRSHCLPATATAVPVRCPKTTSSSCEDSRSRTEVHSLRRIHPSKLSPHTQPCQRHHPVSCCHVTRCHRLAYPSRCCLVRPSSMFHHGRCRPWLPLASRSPRSTSRS